MTDFETEIQNNGYIAYTNRGDSMMPLIRENRDILVIKKIEAPLKKNDAVLFKRENGAYVLHRIIKKCGDGVFLIGGDNRWFAEKIPEDWIIGVLTEVIRDGKHITADSAENKKYLRKLPFVRAKLKIKHFKYKVINKLQRMFGLQPKGEK